MPEMMPVIYLRKKKHKRRSALTQGSRAYRNIARLLLLFPPRGRYEMFLFALHSIAPDEIAAVWRQSISLSFDTTQVLY